MNCSGISRTTRGNWR
jgi:hypothetical protein